MVGEANAVRERIHILGVPVDRISMDSAMEMLHEFISEKTPHFVITADASGIVQAQTDSEFRSLFDRADLITPDSAGVLWAAKRQGVPLEGRVSGVELVERICAESANRGYRIFFLGAAPGIAEKAADKMRLKYPGCNIVGTRDGYFPADRDAEIAEEIAATDPDFLFVAMGIPRQEKFILATQNIIRARVAMGVGGTFDVFSGAVKRAPILFQKMKLEWLWRVLLNPKKIDKVKLLPKFVSLVLKERR